MRFRVTRDIDVPDDVATMIAREFLEWIDGDYDITYKGLNRSGDPYKDYQEMATAWIEAVSGSPIYVKDKEEQDVIHRS